LFLGLKNCAWVLFSFDPETKEWKERGVGKLKILKHPVKGTFRVLLRREQVHKIAVNHIISKDIELKPMQS
jgi:E3 SUMO-protein ligase RanBP2